MALTREDKTEIRQIVDGAISGNEEIRQHSSALKQHGEELKKHGEELRRQGVLLEKIEHDLNNLTSLVSDNLKVKKQVANHEERLGEVETTQTMLKSTVTLHSKQLKAL